MNDARRAALVGARVRRREDPRFLRGRATYVGDLTRPGLLQVAFHRSEVPHARIRAIETGAAAHVAGVVGVFTGRDLEPVVKPIVAPCSMPGYQVCAHPVLATDKVCFVGQAVAAVVAETRYQAEDGAEAIRVDYEALPAVTDIDAAMAPGAPQLHAEVRGNLYNHFHLVAGDVAGAFASAEHVVELEVRNARCAQVSMESRGLVAEWDAFSDDLTVWISHQAPHLFRTGIAEFLGLPASRIRVISPDVGGGFGSKLIVYPEDLVTIALARQVGRPVRWLCDRREDLLTTVHGREQIHRIRAAVTGDARVTAVQVTIKASNGAFPIWPMTAGLDSGQASENVTGPYDIARYERDVYAVATNKAPMGPYRGVGRVSACFAIERTMDEIARRLKLDALEVRRRNVVRRYPHTTPVGLVFESGSSAESLDRMERLLDLPRLRAEHAALRLQGVYRGVGLAAIVEHTALGPQEVSRKGIDMVLGFESACVRVEPDGAITAIVGTHSHGQGHETTFAQLVADQFGVGIERVTVRFGDTAVVPYGLGTWASRSLVYGGGAVILATQSVIDKMIAIAAHKLEVLPRDLAFRDGRVALRDAPTRGLTVAEIAYLANHRANELPEAIEPGLEATRRYRAPDPGSFSNSLHAAVVEVDVRTGRVAILRYVVIEDCGTVVNPTIVEGQLHGGIAQGIGQALLEEAAYDADGQPLAATLADYLVPTAGDVPVLETHHIETPSPLSLGGFKGMGEGGAVNAPAAIANAVTDALAAFGIAVNHTPITPTWIVEAVQAARRAQAAEASAGGPA